MKVVCRSGNFPKVVRLEWHCYLLEALSGVSSLNQGFSSPQGLVSLCSSVARARDPKDEALRPQDPSNPRIQQLHYARLECYQVGLKENASSKNSLWIYLFFSWGGALLSNKRST